MRSKYIVVICFLLLLISISIRAGELSPFGRGRFASDEISIETTSTANENITISAAGSLSGKLRIIAADINRAIFKYRKIIKTKNHPTAVDFADKIDARIQKLPTGLKLILRAPNPAPWSGRAESARIEGDLLLPYNYSLDIDAEYFDLHVTGPFQSVKIGASFGKVRIENILEELQLKCTGRNLSLTDIHGDISIEASNADIHIENMYPADSPARLKNDNGDIFINGCDGSFDIKNSFGKIRFNNIRLTGQSGIVTGTQCPIRLDFDELENSRLKILTTYEDLILAIPNNTGANLYLHTEEDGEIHVKNLAIWPKLTYSNRLELIVGNGGTDINMMVENGGNIEIRGKGRAR